jgi:hypothetical protein
MNLLIIYAVVGCHSYSLVGLAPIYLQLEQLRMASLAAMVYMFAYVATTCHQLPSGHVLLRPVAACSAMSFDFFHDIGMMAVFIPGLEEAQLAAGLLPAYAGMLQTTNINSARWSSWKDAMLVVKQGAQMSCNLYVWSYFEMELVLDGYNSRCPILGDWFLFCPTQNALISRSEKLQ